MISYAFDSQALDDYIIKKQPNAIIDLVNDSLNRTQKVLNLDKGADDKNAILKAAARVKQKAEEDLMKENGKKNGNKSLTNPAQRGVTKPTASASRKGRMEVDEEQDDDEEARWRRHGWDNDDYVWRRGC